MKLYNFLAPILFTLLFFCVAEANAQGIDASVSSGGFSVVLTPKFPAPSEVVTAKVVSNAFNIDNSLITWVVGGKVRLEGVGKKDFTFTTGEAGTEIPLRVEVTTPDFGVVAKNINIRPSDVDILWEADTYTPPFYKGKALATSQSYIKVLGVPSFVDKTGSAISSDNLIYFWKKTYTPNPNDSGVGRNTYFYRAAYTFNDDTIETTVSSPDNGLSINKKTKISILEPKIVFYERKPLEGVRYENSLLGNFTIKEQEVTLRAEPYFFSLITANNNGAAFTWQLDRKNLDVSPDRKSEFTLRKPESGSGHAGISIKISNTGYDLQSASKNMTLSYTN